ncbi:MAG: tetratricopeptide repeat protein [Anaerolineaceae bacterium]|nr:tetratricopeptide repeat protein [Anaerolineaceae bacterium]
MKIQTNRPTLAKNALPQLIFFFLLFVLIQLLEWFESWGYSVALSFAVLVLYQIFARQVLSRHHVRGIRLAAREEFGEALKAFEQSLIFFERYPWLDRYRMIFFMSAGAYGYREMALLNIGAIYMRTGYFDYARGAFERALELNPENEIALNGLETLNQAG